MSKICRAAALTGLACLLAGCIVPGYRPGGSQHSDDTFTYISTPDAPKTISVIDRTTNETVWGPVDVPIGKQLTIKFYEDHDPKNTTRPTLMRWELSEAGREFGELHSAIPAPDRGHRMVIYTTTAHPAVPVPESAGMPATAPAAQPSGDR